MLFKKELFKKEILNKEPLIFILVGISAAVIHLFIVWLLVKASSLTPLQANIAGFLGAVNISYFGHSQFTFKPSKSISVTNFMQFFAIACIGFLINQVAYFYALKWFGEKFYLPILAVVLVLVAVFTFVFSKFWVFAKHGSKN